MEVEGRRTPPLPLLSHPDNEAGNRASDRASDPYEALPTIWPTPVEGTCPVCSSLPLDDLYRGDSTRCLEYVISAEPAVQRAVSRWSEFCDLCKLVRDAAFEWGKELDPRQLKNKYYVACGRPRRQAAQYCHLASEPYKDVEDNFERVVVHADPLSTVSLTRIRGWIETCDKQHSDCHHGPSPLPSRVVDVRDLNRLRLHETTAGDVAKYVALSHCWGTSDPTWATTTYNVDTMRGTGFTLQQMPQTIRDAICITNALGVPYLWVDALCIVQDNMADWTAECARIGDVYTRAHFTIAASNGADDVSGFLGPREFLFTPLWIRSATTVQSFRLFLQTHDDFFRQHMYFTVPEPLHARGWALQEFYLSPRILEFGTSMTTLECRSGIFEESAPGPGFSRSRDDADRLVPCVKDGSVGSRHWADMVADYSKRNLRYESDQLPAVSGIASRIAARTGCTYCAGLWWEDMPYGLLWKRQRGHQLTKPSRFVAPTWTWASVIGPIYYPFMQSHVDRAPLDSVKFEGFYVQTAPENPFGEVQSGLVQLRAMLIPLSVDINPKSHYGPWKEEEAWELETEFKIADTEGDQNFRIRGSFDLQQEAYTEEAERAAAAAAQGNRSSEDAPSSPLGDGDDGDDDDDNNDNNNDDNSKDNKNRRTDEEASAPPSDGSRSVTPEEAAAGMDRGRGASSSSAAGRVSLGGAGSLSPSSSAATTPTTTPPGQVSQNLNVFAVMLAQASPNRHLQGSGALNAFSPLGRTTLEGILVQKSRLPFSYERRGYVRAANLTDEDVHNIIGKRLPQSIILY